MTRSDPLQHKELTAMPLVWHRPYSDDDTPGPAIYAGERVASFEVAESVWRRLEETVADAVARHFGYDA